jgi:hypothetical protein
MMIIRHLKAYLPRINQQPLQSSSKDMISRSEYGYELLAKEQQQQKSRQEEAMN